jgi:hypothetical protein
VPTGLALSASFNVQTSNLSRIVSIDQAKHWISFALRTHSFDFDLNVCTCLGGGERGEAQIRLYYTDVGEDLLSVLGLETGVDNDILAYYKVRECKGRRRV